MNWQTMQHHSPCADVLLDFMLSFNLTQIVTEPTRVQGSSCSILDLIFLSNHFINDETRLSLLDGISDHKITHCTIPLHDSVTPQQITAYPDYSKANDTSILDYLINEYHTFLQLSHNSTTDIDTLWLAFSVIISHCITNYIPTRKRNLLGVIHG